MNNINSNERLLRLNQVIGPNGMIPVSRAAWYLGIKDGRFPKPISLGPNTKAYKLSDIQNLVENGVEPHGDDNA